MTDEELLEEIKDRIAAEVFRSLGPKEQAFANELPGVFFGTIEEKLKEKLKTPEGAATVEAMRRQILREREGSNSSTPRTVSAADQPPADFGPNGAQIQTLFEWIASLDAEGWLGLVLASAMLAADPHAASPENRAMAERIRQAVKTGALVTDRVRRNAMKSGAWPSIEGSMLATAGPQASLAIDAAKRFNPDAGAEEMAGAFQEYADPIGGLTHALRLRPYVSEDEFLLLWGVYEMSDPRLWELRRKLPPLEPNRAEEPLGAAARSGGCLIPVAIAFVAVVVSVAS